MFMVSFFPISSQVHNFCKYAFCLKVIVLFQIKLLFYFLAVVTSVWNFVLMVLF